MSAQSLYIPGRFGGSVARRGFSLLEALFAVTVLGTIMLAVSAAMTASQSVAQEGQKRILAAIACNDLMSEITTLGYDDILLQDGVDQAIGELVSLDGVAYPSAFWSIGRSVEVLPTTMSESGLSVKGVLIRVSAIDEDATLSTVELFVPEPSA